MTALCIRDTSLENFTAELTRAAYSVALQQGIRSSWIELELGLWSALAETVKNWIQESPLRAASDELEVRWERFSVNLTESAFYSAVKQGIEGDFLEMELEMYQAIRLVIRRVGREALRHQIIRAQLS
jgi:hypothetical protein